MYFIQGIGEPTEGLIAQPVRWLLKSWGHDAAQIGTFGLLLSLPWSLKPIYGLISDFLPLAGYRRKSYLVLASAATATSLLVLYVLPPPPGVTAWLLGLLLVPTVGVAFTDVVVDALMVERGQPAGLTGPLQSVQWGSMYAATVLVGLVGGLLSQHGRPDLGFLICGLATLVTLLLALFLVHERPRPAEPHRLRSAATALGHAFTNRTVLGVAGFLFLWNFNPFASSVLNVYMTRELGVSEQFYGTTVALDAVAAIAASVAYGFYCRRVPFGRLLHLSIVAGILATVAYWAMLGPRSAVLITLLVGFTYMTGWLVQLDLAARTCPPDVAGTVFALLMAGTNLSIGLSMGLGGYLYDAWAGVWGPRIAFNLLVGAGALCTAACWLLVPVLRRAHALNAP
jgi:Na+/melibiose symporter-like transporter